MKEKKNVVGWGYYGRDMQLFGRGKYGDYDNIQMYICMEFSNNLKASKISILICETSISQMLKLSVHF